MPLTKSKLGAAPRPLRDQLTHWKPAIVRHMKALPEMLQTVSLALSLKDRVQLYLALVKSIPTNHFTPTPNLSVPENKRSSHISMTLIQELQPLLLNNPQDTDWCANLYEIFVRERGPLAVRNPSVSVEDVHELADCVGEPDDSSLNLGHYGPQLLDLHTALLASADIGGTFSSFDSPRLQAVSSRSEDLHASADILGRGVSYTAGPFDTRMQDTQNRNGSAQGSVASAASAQGHREPRGVTTAFEWRRKNARGGPFCS